MGVPEGELPGAVARDVEHRAGVGSRPAGRRRPSGQPPPLPRPLRATGVGWLVAAAGLVSFLVVVFTGQLRGAAVTVTVVDDTIVRWVADLHLPGLDAVSSGFGALGSGAAISAQLWALLLALVILRRLRHLVVVLVAWTVQGVIIQYMLGPLLRRPRPFGVELRSDWQAWALPSEQIAAFVVVLLGVLYALVPEGRWRQ